MLSINELIRALKRYNYDDRKCIPTDVAQILMNSVESNPFPHIFTVDNISDLVPNWEKDLGVLRISFVYQVNFGGVYIYVKTANKENTEKALEQVNDYENKEFATENDEYKFDTAGEIWDSPEGDIYDLEFFEELNDRIHNYIHNSSDYEDYIVTDLFHPDLLEKFRSLRIVLVPGGTTDGYDT